MEKHNAQMEEVVITKTLHRIMATLQIDQRLDVM